MFSVYSIELEHEHEHGMVGYMGNGTVKNVFFCSTIVYAKE